VHIGPVDDGDIIASRGRGSFRGDGNSSAESAVHYRGPGQLAARLKDIDSVEKRSRRRQRVLLVGKVAHGMAVHDCTIRDLSERGARVHVPMAIGLPEEVRLLILREGLLVRTRKIWSRETLHGLEFIEAEDIQTCMKPQAEPLKRLWRQWVASHR
jgi:hypothetical protein